jgi:hypothetical protein
MENREAEKPQYDQDDDNRPKHTRDRIFRAAMRSSFFFRSKRRLTKRQNNSIKIDTGVAVTLPAPGSKADESAAVSE